MLLVHRKPWFKASAAVTAASMLWFTLAEAAHAGTRSATPRGMKVEEVASHLGVDAATLSGESPETAKRRIAEKRAAALDQLAKLTSRDRERAELERRAAEIRRAHAASVLGGVARAAEEARAAAAERSSSKSALAKESASRRLEAAAVALRRGIDRVKKSGSVSPAVAGALGKAGSLSRAAASSARSRGGEGEVLRLAPAKRVALDTKGARLPVTPQRLAPPRPRDRVQLGAAPDVEQRDFYASVLDGEGVQVETEVGTVDAALLAAGLPPAPMIAMAGLPGEAEALLGLAAGALPGPAPADLTEGVDARITPEIRAQVAALGNDPLAIFNFVHDGFDAEPYYGSKKGSAGAWEDRAGNDADLSSVLVAMLRAAGIPARYEYGTVDLSAEQAMAWTGTTEVYQAGDALATGGVPTIVVDREIEHVVRVEHVWVRAWVPYSNYRGIQRAGSRPAWIRLDPTLKRARLRDATNLRGKVDFDLAGFLSTVNGDTPLARYEAQLRAYAQANGIPCRTVDDLIPERARVADGLSILPAELPARIHGSLASFSALPSTMRHSASISIEGLQLSLALPEIAGSALTVRYRGATPSDEAAIAAAGSIGQLANPSSARVVPTLVVDGAERARGDAVVAGSAQELVVQITVPHDGTAAVRHQLYAGSVFALGLSTGRVADSVVARREAELSQAVLAGATGDDLEAARGNRALWRYFWNLSRDWERLFGLGWARAGLGVSEGIAGRRVVAETLYDVPVSIRPGNFVIDVPRLVAGPYMVDGQERDRLSALFTLAGYDGSAWEHLIWEQTVNNPAISTVRVLQASRAQGQQLRTIVSGDGTDFSTLPFSEAAREDIADALHRGLAVTMAERPVTWGTYPNAEGYVLRDPRTGAAAYRIQGLYSGGEDNGAGGPGDGPVCACDPKAPAASSVSVTSGRMTFAETDLSVPARGIPITFARSYESMSPYGGRLGNGWQHTYEVRLIAEPDGSMTYLNDRFQAERFTLAVDGTFTAPAGFYERLTRIADGYRIAFKDGLEYRFRPDGQLSAIQDPTDHVVLLRYDAGRLSTVTDAGGRTALAFEYDANGLLATVRDAAGRFVQFGHESGDLASVTDVLGNVQRYAYDADHRMASKTDRNGYVTYEAYDSYGRWIGSEDPAGNGRAMSYDALNRRAVHEDKAGGLTIHEYDDQGNEIAVTDPVGNRREMRYDGAHNKTWEKDARGNETGFSYDGNGNLLTRSDPVGGTTVYTYDGGGRVLTVTTNNKLVAQNTYDSRGLLQTAKDALGKVTQYGYSDDGLPQTITQPGSAVTTIGYNADGTVSTIGDAEGGTTQVGYDAYGHLRTIKDPLLNERTLVADAAGRIASMTDANQKTTSFEYDAEGNRTAVVDPDAKRTEFGYDALNRLATVKDAAGAISRTEYDPEGRVLSRADPLGRASTYAYDAAGRLLETTDAAGNTTTQGYCADVSSQACTVVDPVGNFTQVQFDALGRPTTTIDANGRIMTEHYDAFGRRDSTVVAGQETRYEYDDAGRLTKVTDALSGTTQYGYDDRGNRTSVTDANNRITYFGYDRANRLVWERNPIQPIGGETRYEYDAGGNRRFKTDGNLNRIEYVYDANRRLTKVLFPGGATYEYAYDARGNRTLERSPDHQRVLGYDDLGRLARVEDTPTGAPDAAKQVISYSYDAAGQRRRMAIDTGEAVEYRWDAAGRLLETTDPQGETTRFSYDAAGRRTSATYGNGTRATWAYDAVGQVLSIAYLDRAGGVQTAFGYGYDAVGNRTYKAFANGTKEEYGYDGLNRLVRAKYPSDRVVEYAYDAVGNRTWTADTGKGTKTRWAVSATASSTAYGLSPSNATGAPDTSSWGPSTTAGSWLEVRFGAAERANGIRVHETQAAPFVMRIDLTDDTGASHTVYSGGDSTKDGGWLLVSFPTTAYRVAKAKVYTSPRPGGTETVEAVGLDLPSPESYTYNGFNQLQTVTGADGSLTTFGYDGNGNQTTKSVRTGWVTQKTSYVYDQDNRLRSVTVPSGALGQATVQWASSATASSELQSGTQPFSAYQATGAPSNEACIQDGKAWQPSGGDTSAQWLKLEYATPAKAVGVRVHEQGDGRAITKVELVDEGGASHTVWTGTDTTVCGGWFEIAFEETSYKVKSVKVTTGGVAYEQIEAVGVMSAPAAGPTLTSTYAYDANGLRVGKSDTAGETRYLLDGLSVIAQYAPDGARQAFYVQSLARIDEVLSVVNSSGKFWYQADALGSVYTLTTGAGDVRARGGYDVFGEPVAEYGQQVGQPFGFTGREHDLDSGLVYSRARYLNTISGRWNGPDPYGFVNGPNLYAYAGANPIRYVDPTGLFFDAVASLLGRNAILAEEALAAADGQPVDYSNATVELWAAISAIDVMNFSAGLGDALLPYVGRKLRSFTAAEECIDYESGAYVAGTITGWLVWTLLFGAVTVEMQTAKLINLTKGENWITNNLFRWGKQAFKGSNGAEWHFHLGPGTLMNHHLPQQARTWGYHLLALIRRLF